MAVANIVAIDERWLASHSFEVIGVMGQYLVRLVGEPEKVVVRVCVGTASIVHLMDLNHLGPRGTTLGVRLVKSFDYKIWLYSARIFGKANGTPCVEKKGLR